MDKITAEDILDDKDFKEIIDDDVATAEEIANILNVCTYITDIVNDEDEGALQEVLEAIPNVTPVLTRVGKILVTNLRELQLKLLKAFHKKCAFRYILPKLLIRNAFYIYKNIINLENSISNLEKSYIKFRKIISKFKNPI